jgi:subfamily B ATP-binding cassette protein MsbA
MRDLAAITWRLRPHLRGGRYLISAVILSSFGAALFEGVGVSLLIPLLSLLLGGEGAIPMRPIRWMQEFLPNHSSAFYVLMFCFLILGAIVSKNLVHYLCQMLAARLRCRITINLRQSLFERVMQADLHLFEQRTGGEIANVFMTETTRTLAAIEVVITLIQRMSMGFFYVLGLLFISWQLTFATFLLVFSIGTILAFVYRRLSRASFNVTALNQRLASRISEVFSGIRVVRSTNSQQREAEQFKEVNSDQARTDERISRQSQLLMPLAETVAVAGAMLIVGGAYIFLVKPQLMLPSYLLGFGFILLRLLPLVNQIYGLQGYFFSLSWGVKEVEKWLNSPQFPNREFGREIFSGVRESITFEHVGFAYTNGTVALQDVSFTVSAGQTVALVGSSGSGKSTAAGLVLRFRQPTAGCIRVDGRDYWEFSAKSWHDSVAVVEQDAFLFHDTLANNVAYGFANTTPEAVRLAIKQAYLEDVVASLPQGLDTIIGERGTSLSGGQRQRLAIARALVRQPNILVLDEATSALDSISEREVQTALDLARHGRTVLVIAHRLSTIQQADRIIVLDKGRVVEQGTWTEFSERQGAFAKLLQAGERH